MVDQYLTIPDTPVSGIAPSPSPPPGDGEVHRPVGVVKDGLLAKNASYDKKAKLRWFMLYRDRLDFCEKLPMPGKPVSTKGSISLQGLEVELCEGKAEIILRQKKGKDIHLGAESDAVASDWYSSITSHIVALPKAAVGKKQKGKPPPVFGSTLSTLLDWERQMDDTIDVPLIVRECMAYLRRETAMRTEGIFRLSGSLAKINELKALYDERKPTHVDEIADPNIVSGTFKLWLREMPEPLLGFENYHEFIRIAKEHKPDELDQYAAVCRQLPPENFALLREILYMAADFAALSDVNKMTSDNLAIVIGPNLLKSDSTDMALQVQESQFVTDIFKKFIDNVPKIVGERDAQVDRTGRMSRSISISGNTLRHQVRQAQAEKQQAQAQLQHPQPQPQAGRGGPGMHAPGMRAMPSPQLAPARRPMPSPGGQGRGRGGGGGFGGGPGRGSPGLAPRRSFNNMAPGGARGPGVVPGRARPGARASDHSQAPRPGALAGMGQRTSGPTPAAPLPRTSGTMTSPQQLLSQNKTSPRRHTNALYFDGDIDLTEFDWFHGTLSSQEAYTLLQTEPMGTFLVRNSSRAGCFVVSWVSNDDGLIIHTLVTPRSGGGYDIEGDRRSYPSVPGIVSAYAKHLIKNVSNEGKFR